MNQDFPLYTEKRECQDCYKCVRHCPVKAISVCDGSALVSHELCIYCGKCYEVCPVGAKKIPNERPRVEQLLRMNKDIYVSLSPSFFSEFVDREEEVLDFLFNKGFKGASETAIGAEYVSREITEIYREKSPQQKNLISTACPVVVNLINNYYPHLWENMTPLASPMVVHGRYLREKHGEDIGVIFIGPCIAKKGEARQENIDAALTFEELQEWMKGELPEKKIKRGIREKSFLEAPSGKASLYPLDGGMIQSFGPLPEEDNFYHISGIQRIMDTLDELKKGEQTEDFSFFELLSCSGGCINGPARIKDVSHFKKRSDLVHRAKGKEPFKDFIPSPSVHFQYPRRVIEETKIYTEEEITSVLVSMDKFGSEDILNCGGCGYNSCRGFAIARLQGRAEESMCAGNMRKQAQKKVNALIKTMPSGVVIVDRELKIVECNSRFISYFTDSELGDFNDVLGKIRGVDVGNFGPFPSLFSLVLPQIREKEERISLNGAVYKSTFFTIEKDRLAGAIFQDVTKPTIRRETIIKRADQVIRKNLESVQQIASLLGENAAETEMILNSVIEELNPPDRKTIT